MSERKPGKQIGGNHYERMDPQPVEIMERFGLQTHDAMALKYFSRAGTKEGNSVEQDLAKGYWWLVRAIVQEDLLPLNSERVGMIDDYVSQIADERCAREARRILTRYLLRDPHGK